MSIKRYVIVRTYSAGYGYGYGYGDGDGSGDSLAALRNLLEVTP